MKPPQNKNFQAIPAFQNQNIANQVMPVVENKNK